MYQFWVITLTNVPHTNERCNGETGGGREEMETLGHFVFYKPKTALKNKV